jgi:hypothetical protein
LLTRNFTAPGVYSKFNTFSPHKQAHCEGQSGFFAKPAKRLLSSLSAKLNRLISRDYALLDSFLRLLLPPSQRDSSAQFISVHNPVAKPSLSPNNTPIGTCDATFRKLPAAPREKKKHSLESPSSHSSFTPRERERFPIPE